MDYTYIVSIIIPVYNAEKYLEKCIESLLNQTIFLQDMEIILIDDGSTDGSAEIYQEYVQKYKNIIAIKQENQGVSVARNAGIQAAKGKYIMFLDSDDTLSCETVKNVTDFFDAHYNEIDLVTYPLKYIKENETDLHWKYKNITTNGVYDLEKNSHLTPFGITFCIKNTKEFFFDIELCIGEDHLYFCKELIKKGKIGFVVNASYNYLFRNNSLSHSIKVHPYNAFSQFINCFNSLLDLKKLNIKTSNFIDNIILYNLNWRLKEEYLYKKDKESKNEIRKIVNHIDNRNIWNYPKMDECYKAHFLSLKDKDRPFVDINQNNIAFCDSSGQITSFASIFTVIRQIKIQNTNLYILGYLKNITFDFTSEKPHLFAKINNNRLVEIDLFESQWSQYWCKTKTNKFYGFHFNLDLKNIETISFYVEINDNRYPCSYYFAETTPVNSELKRSYVANEQNLIEFKNNSFIVHNIKSTTAKELQKNFMETLWQKNKKAWLLHKIISKKKIWLYRDAYHTIDNAYYQFKHDIKKHDGIKRYYLYNKGEIDVKKLFSLRERKYLIPFGRIKHKKILLKSEKVLLSFGDAANIFIPFCYEDKKMYFDLFKFEVIYLQHGVLHAKLPYLYSKEKLYLADEVVVSTTFEKETFEKELAYQTKDIITCGMPRLDNLSNQTILNNETKKIAFVPSWRSYLVKQENSQWQETKDFPESNYYNEICKILNSDEIAQLCKNNNVQIDFKLHPNMKVYEPYFENMGNESIHVVREMNVSDYDLCITDFSSFVFDFIYLGKQVIIFLPDKNEFYGGLHTYNDVTFPLEDFEFYAENSEQLLERLKDIFNLWKKGTTKNNMQTLFLSLENNHKEKLYEALMENK